MSPEFHQRVRRVFDEALERPEAERLVFVELASQGDAALVQAVNRLLQAQSESQSFLGTAARPTQRIGRYLIHGELGRGAMGVVYDAIDPMIGRKVAVKVIHLKSFSERGQAEVLKDRLFREARSAGRLFHPGIVIIFDVGEEGDAAFITMERVEGRSLQEILVSKRVLGVEESMAILRQVASALDYAHQQGVVHRDIKPANIMLHNDVLVKVADFGIAKLMSPQTQTITSIVMGTPSYMSPEQVEAKHVDGRSDQFSLAVMAYELLAGTTPFKADSMAGMAHQIVYGDRPSAESVNTSLPAGVDDALRRGLAKVPEQRFPNCMDFVNALEAAFKRPVERVVSAPVAPAAVEVVRKPKRRRPWAYVPVVAGAVVIVAVGIVFYGRQHVQSPEPTAVVSQSANQEQPAPDAKEATPPAMEPVAETSADTTKASTEAPAKPAPTRAGQWYSAAMKARAEGRTQESVVLFKRAADMNDSRAMTALGDIYNDGEGDVHADENRAVYWFQKGAAAGNAESMLYLGAAYQLGGGVEKSDPEAVRWFQKASDLGNEKAMYDLGNIYAQGGRGVRKSAEKAFELYSKAAALGHEGAKKRLREIMVQR
jgi:tRNA A-37 threonylcarbamoyl transferase component Bud32